MAYYLLIPPTTAAKRVQLLSDITQTASGNFEIEFEVDILGTNAIVAADNAGNGQNLIFFTTLTNLQLRIANSQRNFTLPQSAAGRHVYSIVSNTAAGNIQVFQDGVSCGTTTGNTFWPIGRIADLNNQTSRHFGLYYLKVRNASNTLIHHYDPSASNGTGATLIDTVGGNNGTLQNFPESDSEKWIFYSNGGTVNQSTASYDLGSIDFAVSSQITAPAINAAVSYDIGAISYAVSAQQSAPQFAASVGYEIGSIGFVVQANTGAAIRTITALYDIGTIGWQVYSEWLPDDATAGIGYDIGEIAFSSSVLNIPEGGFPSEPSKQYPNNPGWRYSVFFR